MIKIIHLITGLNVGGAENQLVNLVLQSDPARFKHIVVSMQDQGLLGQKLIDQGSSLYTLGMKRGIPSIKACFKFIQILRVEKPDILQTWLYHADLLGLLIGKWMRVPKVVWNIRCSNMDKRQYSALTSIVIKMGSWLSRFSNAIVVNSNAGKAAHQVLGYQSKEWLMIPNGFKTQYFKPDSIARANMRAQLKIEDDRPLLGMVARFDPQKDYGSLLLALKYLCNRTQNFHMVLVGAGVDENNPELTNKIQDFGLKDQVSLLGPMNKIPDLMNALDIFVLSSAFGEGFPNVLGEAMATGLPCIATDVGDSAVIIGDTGIVVPFGSPEALAEALGTVLDWDKVKRQALGAKARQRILDYYTTEATVDRYEQAYRKLYSKG